MRSAQSVTTNRASPVRPMSRMSSSGSSTSAVGCSEEVSRKRSTPPSFASLTEKPATARQSPSLETATPLM